MSRPQERTHLSLEGRYATTENHELVRATGMEDFSKVADGVFVSLSFKWTSNIWLTFTHGERGTESFNLTFVTPHFDVYDITEPFSGKSVETRKKALYELVDNALKTGFWNGKESPLSEADTIQIRDEFYKKIEEYPVLN